MSWGPLRSVVLREIDKRFPGARQVALALVQIEGILSSVPRFGKTASRSQDVSQIKQGIGVLAVQVSLGGECYRRECEFGCFGVTATISDHPGRQSPAEDM